MTFRVDASSFRVCFGYAVADLSASTHVDGGRTLLVNVDFRKLVVLSVFTERLGWKFVRSRK